jgi:hypothetical protein
MEDDNKKFKFFFAWYDMWIGVFVDKKKKFIYFCPFFCVVLRFKYGVKKK